MIRKNLSGGDYNAFGPKCRRCGRVSVRHAGEFCYPCERTEHHEAREFFRNLKLWIIVMATAVAVGLAAEMAINTWIGINIKG